MNDLETIFQEKIQSKVSNILAPLKNKINALEDTFKIVYKLQEYPDLLSGKQIKEALGIGHKKFKKLTLNGLDDKSGFGRPVYWKPQLIEIITKSKNLFA